jgi:SAM-dependent methyltransferase
MGPSTGEQNADEFYTRTYDDSVPDWPGEIDFYREMASRARSKGGSVLEIACGTGRVAIRLAQDGVKVVGLDLSANMLEIAGKKSLHLENVCWFEGDMRSFELGEAFEVAIIPGHAFQNLNTPQDQVACLGCIKRHLNPGGTLIVHLDPPDIPWLGDLRREKGGVFEAEEQFQHPDTGHQIQALRAWSYEPSTQTAIVQSVWEELDADGRVVNRVERGPIRLHCVFPFEMEHLLARTGFEVETVYGDFFRQGFRDDSPDMIWVARSPHS